MTYKLSSPSFTGLIAQSKDRGFLPHVGRQIFIRQPKILNYHTAPAAHLKCVSRQLDL